MEAAWTVPRWVDYALVERGACVSRTHGLAHLLALNFGALLEGYASHSLAAPLVATGRLRQDTRKRLYETGQVFHNGRQAGGLVPGAPGHRSILAVRLLHAMVRRHLRRVDYQAPDGGAFIHQLDTAHTAVQICHVGRRGLARLGVDLSSEDTLALHHFMRLVHTWHGVDAALLPDTPEGCASLHARHGVAALRTANHSASRVARGRLLGPPLQWAQESLYMHSLARGLGAIPQRAFGTLADHRRGRRATL